MYGVYSSNAVLLATFDDAADAANYLFQVQEVDPFAYMGIL
jgi:hypothetical protein